MIRPFVFSFAVATVAACALLTAPPVSGRAPGSFSIDTTGPVTPTPLDPFGGVELCTAHLRKQVWDPSSGNYVWVYHMASGYDYQTCHNNAQPYLSQGYEHNENPGFEYCACHPGYNGMVAGPAGHGPLGMHNLTQDQMQVYEEGLLELRQNYQLDQFAEEYELLLQTIEEMDEPEGL